MFALILTGLAIALGAGVVIKLVLDGLGGDARITRNELIAGTAALTLVICPLTAFVGTQVAIASNTTFHEYWNGWETAADVDVRTCTRDGSCSHTYRCDPYLVQHPATYDSHGKLISAAWTETRYHRCPVGTEEGDYIVRTSVGDAVIARGHYTPNTRPWGDRPLDDQTTPPAAWAAAKARLDAGNPGPATSVHDYTNYVLASERTVLKQYSAAIEKYRAADLLPAPAAGVRGHYLADKAHFVGWTPTAAAAQEWQDAVGRTAAALGSAKQGDLQVVLVRTQDVTDPDEYTSALLASWQDPQLGRDRLAKNSVVLVAGTTDGRTVAWARVGTGMPVGNRALEAAARTGLVGVPWTPHDLVGTPAVTLTGGEPTPVSVPAGDQGALEQLLWDRVNGFTRVSMSCEDADENCVGFDYLKGELTPTPEQNATIVTVMVVLALGVWAAAGWYGDSWPVAPVRRYVNGSPSGAPDPRPTRPQEAAPSRRADLRRPATAVRARVPHRDRDGLTARTLRPIARVRGRR